MSTAARSPLKVSLRSSAIGFAGGLISILLLASLSSWTSTLWIMAPFGASAVLAFGLWDAPLSQPRNIIGGHLISTCIGLCVYHLFGSSPMTLALGVGVAIGAMMLTKTTHPPAGADPIVVITAGCSWSYLVSPVLIGSLLIVLLALLINNLEPGRRYPTFWY
ncbi:HPP family protein [Paenibacillus sp. ACRRX]|uniref:HPP family protein n=1 Tax=unclassified Paenibacillus TaxID=185978 RepID=UPI001EF73FF1|nr:MULTISPECIES: HPP family protein [unclassified Paenibacillus]MCG7408878.1 HPP family protein [Paenibacillus sp. ACRRX]MDK8182211.1 HPP family protein [Paenibacillus sp. UMB4589-SE434]